jgi:hypothetical protein
MLWSSENMPGTPDSEVLRRAGPWWGGWGYMLVAANLASSGSKSPP